MIHTGGRVPLTREELWRREQQQLQQIRRDLRQNETSTALYALLRYVMDKLEEQRYVDTELFESWEELLWFLDDLCEQSNSIAAKLAERTLHAFKTEKGNAFAQLLQLSQLLDLEHGLNHSIRIHVSRIVSALEKTRVELRGWLYESPTALPCDVHEARFAPSILKLDSLLRIASAGIRSYFQEGWICSELELSLLAELSQNKLTFPEDEW